MKFSKSLKREALPECGRSDTFIQSDKIKTTIRNDATAHQTPSKLEALPSAEIGMDKKGDILSQDKKILEAVIIINLEY